MVSQYINQKLSDGEGIIKGKIERKIKKDPDRNYDLAEKIVKALGIKESVRHMLDFNIHFSKEVRDYPDEWWEEYEKSFDINEVIDFLVPLIDRNFTYEELHALVDLVTVHEALIRKWDNTFIDSEIQKKWDLMLEEYDNQVIEGIIEDLKVASNMRDDGIKFNKSGNTFQLSVNGGQYISNDYYGDKIGSKRFMVGASSLLGMNTSTAASKISEKLESKLKNKRIDRSIPSNIGFIVQESLLKCNVQRVKKIKVVTGPGYYVRITGELI